MSKKTILVIVVGIVILILIPTLFYLLKQHNLSKNGTSSSLPEPTYGEVILKKVTIADCPITNCRNATVIDESPPTSTPSGDSSYFYGLGFKTVTSGSAIKAGIDGRVTVEDKTENGQSVTYLYITNIDKNIILGYKFIKNSINLKTPHGNVNLDDVIGSVSSTDKIADKSGEFSLITYVKIISSNFYAVISPDTSGKMIEASNE